MKKQPATVDSYIAAAPEPARGIMKKMRQLIKAAAPKAFEGISYRLPL